MLTSWYFQRPRVGPSNTEQDFAETLMRDLGDEVIKDVAAAHALPSLGSLAQGEARAMV